MSVKFQMPRLLRGGLSGHVFVVTHYKEQPDGSLEALTKFDVTEDFDRLIPYSALPEPATGLDVERLAQAMWNMSDFDPDGPYVEVKRVEVREFTEQVAAEYVRLVPPPPQHDPEP